MGMTSTTKKCYARGPQKRTRRGHGEDSWLGSAQEARHRGPWSWQDVSLQTVIEGEQLRKRRRDASRGEFHHALVHDLAKDLSELAKVFTFHGYCRYLLHRNVYLREGLGKDFTVFPRLPTLIKSDWAILNMGVDPPEFVKLMRRAVKDNVTQFYLDRSNFYDAVAFDDMVYRVYLQLLERPDAAERFDLILVDEYQDFNFTEVGLLNVLALKSPIVIAGDDDQVLYGSWRESSCDFIRSVYNSTDFETCSLPFCMRCPEVVVQAFGDVVAQAVKRGLLKGRIPKTFRYYPPTKEADSMAHPKVIHLHTSVQKKADSVNYFGRLVEQVIQSIPVADVKESHVGGYPTILLIGGHHYLDQVSEYLARHGYAVDERVREDDEIQREDALRQLKNDPNSNLGWRIALEVDKPAFFVENAPAWLASGTALVSLIPSEYRDAVLSQAAGFEESEDAEVSAAAYDESRPTIKLTSFEGAKGLSAQYVFIVGVHDGDLPRSVSRIRDVEVCKFLVALTRTRKQCYILTTGHFGDKKTKQSVFVGWIASPRKVYRYVDKTFWTAKR
jgi:hypothetical protein